MKIYIPKTNLSSYVEFFWFSSEENPSTAKERVLPNGASQLIINLGNDTFRHFNNSEQQQKQEYGHSVLTGIHTRHIFMDPATRLSTVGVVLQPGAISSLFGIPASEFMNQVVNLETLLNADISALRQQLIAAPTVEDKFRLFESFLSQYISSNFQINSAVTFAVAEIDSCHGTMQIADILDKTGYSRRWTTRVFKEMSGFTPKQYARICRFQYALKLIRENSNPNWASLAVSCGYFDQSHFIHDFKDLSGISPSEYYNNQTDQINHLPA